MPAIGLVIVAMDSVIIVSAVAGVIYLLSTFAGTTGNPNDITKASQFLWLYFGLPVVAVVALIATFVFLRKK